MKYISIARWRDLTDGHLYREGEEFPFDGREIPEKRLEALTGSGNGAGYPLIEANRQKAEPTEDRKDENAPGNAQKAREQASGTGEGQDTRKTEARRRPSRAGNRKKE